MGFLILNRFGIANLQRSGDSPAKESTTRAWQHVGTAVLYVEECYRGGLKWDARSLFKPGAVNCVPENLD